MFLFKICRQSALLIKPFYGVRKEAKFCSQMAPIVAFDLRGYQFVNIRDAFMEAVL